MDKKDSKYTELNMFLNKLTNNENINSNKCLIFVP